MGKIIHFKVLITDTDTGAILHQRHTTSDHINLLFLSSSYNSFVNFLLNGTRASIYIDVWASSDCSVQKELF